MSRRGGVRRMVSMPADRPTNIFIADDSQVIRERLEEMLAPMKQVVIVGQAANARDAVSRILLTTPDSVLLDLKLGQRDGLEVMRTVRQWAPQIVFVVLTNHSEPQYRRACSAAGAHYFLDKATEFYRVRDVIAEIAATRH